MSQAQARRVHVETLEALETKLDIEFIDVESFVDSVQVAPEIAESTFERAEQEGLIEPVDDTLYRIR